MSIKKLTGAQLKKAKSDLAALKKLGLYSGDARKQPTRYARDQIKKYSDVLAGRAKVVTLPKRKDAKTYTEIFRTKARKVVVPARKGEKFFYSKKSGEIFSYNTEYGHAIRRIFPKHALTEATAADLPKGKNIRFAIPIGTGSGTRRMRFSTFKELSDYMKSDSLKRYNKWQNYVEIEEILGNKKTVAKIETDLEDSEDD